MPIDFYYSPLSAPCNAIIMMAKGLGVELNLIPIDISKGENLTPEYLKINPQHTIPAINDNGFSLWESRAILVYLAEKYGKDDSLYPKDAQKRALIHQRLYFDMGTVTQRLGEYLYPQFRDGAPADPEKLQKALDGIQFLNTFLEGLSFVAGNTLSVADYAIASSICPYLIAGMELKNYPNVERWFGSVKKVLPGWAEFEQNMKLLAGFVEGIKQKNAAAAK